MNKLSTISVALVLAGLAVASGANAQSKTREQVLAELQQARASGELVQRAAEMEGVGALAAPANAPKARSVSSSNNNETAQPAAAAPAKGKTRAEVVAELQRARETGELEEQFSEGGPGYFAVTRGISGTPVLAGK
ncbi:DUF4148 domain-containing protein [Paucibacter soli]|uniref:DUF4148 domain-containing protein n=1 Tax=Paucibacter soli TaxID=3133433 RepID=UPI0030B2E991